MYLHHLCGSPSPGESLGPLTWQCHLLQNQHLPTYLQPQQLPPYSIICFPESFMLFPSLYLKHLVQYMANSHINFKAQLKCCHLREAFRDSPGRIIPLYNHKNLNFPYLSTYSLFDRHQSRDLLCSSLIPRAAKLLTSRSSQSTGRHRKF